MTIQKPTWQTISSKQVYKNPWMEVQEDKVLRPDGKEGIYGFIIKSPGVYVIAHDQDDSIYFINEYRYALKKTILQLPVGTIDGKSSVLENAKRELLEETGIQAKKWTELGKYFVAPGHETTYEYVALAENLDTSKLNINQEGDESIEEIVRLSIAEVKKMIRDNKIECGLTLSALNLFFQKTGK
jgi:8-oxo-dGTP pyrophosphatase MutT (NUDIX family)